MTPTNEPLTGTQARIEELRNTIAEREALIKTRGQKLKEEIEAELSPMKLVRKHPFAATAFIFTAGMLLGKGMRGKKSTSLPISERACAPAKRSPVRGKSALSAIGLEVLRTAKELGFASLQHYIDKKIL